MNIENPGDRLELSGTNARETAAHARARERAYVDELHVEGTEAGPEKLLVEYKTVQEELDKAEKGFQEGIDKAAQLRADDPRKNLFTIIGRKLQADIDTLKARRDELGKRILDMGGTLETMQ